MSGHPPTVGHFRVLQRFGRSRLAKEIAPRKREELWRLSCQTGQVPYVEYERVVTAWKAMVTGNSQYTRIAVALALDDNEFITVGVCHRAGPGQQWRSVAAHTDRTRTILGNILDRYADGFKTPDEFLANVEKLAKLVLKRKAAKEKRR